MNKRKISDYQSAIENMTERQTTMKIRSATIDDSIEILRMMDDLEKEVDHPFNNIKLDGKERDRKFSRLVEKINDATAFVLVAQEGDEITGFTAGHMGHDGIHPALIGHCSELYVRPARRGKRTAHNLIQAIEREFREAGADLLEFNQSFNEMAVTKWKRRGYIPTQINYQRQVKHG